MLELLNENELENKAEELQEFIEHVRDDMAHLAPDDIEAREELAEELETYVRVFKEVMELLEETDWNESSRDSWEYNGVSQWDFI